MLFSLYNEKAAEYDQKLAENWREDAQGVMLLVRNPSYRARLCSPDIARVVS